MTALIRTAFVATFACLLAGGIAQAQDDADLSVGVFERAPYSMAASDGAYQGIALDLWRMVAEDLSLSYALVPLQDADPLEAVAGGTVDLALGVDAIPLQEGAGAGYLIPFHTATLAVASERELGLFRVAQSLLSGELLRVVASLCVLLLLVGALIWAIERRRNAQQFHKNVVEGLGDGFWWAGVTLTTIGYGDKAPITFFGRAVAMIWMLMGLAVSAALTASVVAAVDLTGDGGLDIPGDLADRRVAVVEGTSTAAYLDGLGVSLVEVTDMRAAIAAVNGDEADALAGGHAALAAALSGSGADLSVSTTSQDPQYVTIAVGEGVSEELRRALDRSVLTRITSDTWWELVARYTNASE